MSKYRTSVLKAEAAKIFNSHTASYEAVCELLDRAYQAGRQQAFSVSAEVARDMTSCGQDEGQANPALCHHGIARAIESLAEREA